MPILVVVGPLFGDCMRFVPLYSVWKVPSRDLVFCAFCRHGEVGVGLRFHTWACVLPVTLSFLVQSRWFYVGVPLYARFLCSRAHSA